MFDQQDILKNHKNVIREIAEGKRRIPQGQRPISPTANDGRSFGTPGLETLFEDTQFFGVILMMQLGDQWCIEETSDNLLRTVRDPIPARRYIVFYNALELGTIELGEGFSAVLSHGREVYVRDCLIEVSLNYARFIPYDGLNNLLYQIEFLVSDVDSSAESKAWGRYAANHYEQAHDPDDWHIAGIRARARMNATEAMTRYLWDVQRAFDYVPVFKYRAGGPYTMLRELVERWVGQGLDPDEMLAKRLKK
jgi:hypothetical protein